MKRISLITIIILVFGLCVVGVSSFAQEKLQEKIKLNFWSLITREHHETLLAGFYQLYPNTKVKLTIIPWPDYWPKLGVAIGAGTAPDIMDINCSWVPKRVEIDDLLMPLDKYFAEEMNDFLEASVEEAVWKGKLYAMPFFQSTNIIYYNQGMFREIGVEPPRDIKNAWTWDKIVELGKKLTKDLDDDGNPDIWGLVVQQAFEPYQLDPLIQSNGADVFSPDMSTVDGYLNSPEAIEALQFYGNLFNTWTIAPKGAFQDELFGIGKAAMFWGGEWSMATFENDFPNLKYGVMPLPYFKKKVTPCGSWHIGINKRTKYPDAAARVIGFYTSWSGIDVNYLLTRHLPVRKSTYRIYGEIFGKYPLNIMRDQLMTSAIPRPRHADWAVMVDFMRKMWRDVMHGENAKKAADFAVDRIEKVLKK